MAILIFVLLILCGTYESESAKILGVFPAPSYSHFTLASTLMKALATRGHQVTVISPYSQKPPLENYRDVELTNFANDFEHQRAQFFDLANVNIVISELFLNYLFLNSTELVFKMHSVQQLLKSGEHFDLVIVEDFVSHALHGFCYYYKAPCIIFHSIGLSRLIASQVGNPTTPSYIPDFQLPYGSNMNFFERLHNSAAYMFCGSFRYFYAIPQHNALLQKYFPGAPHIYDLYCNVSLVLTNSHVSINSPVPLVPNIIEIGGYHVKPPKKLPKDLQNYLDKAKEGVIYFSMGSNLRSIDMPKEKRDIILKTFSRLEQQVLWKWEDESLPGKPENVKISKWLPQPDILAHPNTKLFITHGGLLSTTEAIYYGVPVVGIPIYGDQKMNLANAINNGYGLGVSYSELTEEKLFEAIQNVLANPRYQENAKTRSKIMHDQPLKPLDKAMFWIEYVLRHRGAPHLRSAATNLTWYQYLLLDVIVFVLSTTVIIVTALYFVITKFICCKRHSKLISKNKKIN